jgi:hypothetical protein
MDLDSAFPVQTSALLRVEPGKGARGEGEGVC